MRSVRTRTYYFAPILILLVTCATSSLSPICEQVCALREQVYPVEFQAQGFLLSLPFKIHAGQRRCEERFKEWAVQANNFLHLFDGGVNETTSDCPTVHKPIHFNIRTPTTTFNGSDIRSSHMNFFKKTSSATRCMLFFNHYIVKKSKSGRKYLFWIKADNAQNNDTIIAFINATSGLPVPVNAGEQPRPCTTSSCTDLSAMWRGHQLYENSIFANFTDRDVPGLQDILNIIEENAERVGNLQSDLSASNLAILSLPLALSIPPISLMETVSPLTTITYVVATDILAALPLMIKGIELMVAIKSRPNLVRDTALSIGTNEHRIFENFNIKCGYNGIVNPNTAALIIALALWSMFSSIYVEFLFWRSKQEGVTKRVELVIEKDQDQYVPHSDEEEYPSTYTNQSRRLKLKEILWEGGRKWITLLILLLAGSYILHLVAAYQSDLYSRYTLYPFTVIFVITHLVLSNQAPGRHKHRISKEPSDLNKASNQAPCKDAGFLLLGICMGLIGGPLYIALAVLGNETSKKLSVGGNIGFAYLGLTLLVVFGESRNLEGHGTIFVWMYVIAVIISQIVQSNAQERSFWKYSVMGGALGVLFGPFGFLFIRIFPENRSDKTISARLQLGCAYGAIFCIVSLFPVAYSSRQAH